jgi:ABC-2 type transport system ATP-binding protein
MHTVIETHGLTRTFGGRAVVDRLDLSVPAGAIYALLGDNGAGKSTTIRLLTGLLQADEGSASVLGIDCWAGAVGLRHRVGYVPEKPRYYDWMTVGELGDFAAAFHRPGYRERYRALIERYQLGRAAKLKTLSKGGYARVGLALALACDPEVLILDEPTSGLDLFTRREFLGSMVELAAEGRTILISSHAVAELERVASHAAFLAEGRLLLAGPLDELRQRLLRVAVRHDGSVGVGSGLGGVIDSESLGKEWRAVLLDGDRAEVEALRGRPSVLGLDESPLSLEEMYTALLARFHRKPAGHAANREPALAERGGRP